jgi:hypothetical protein
MLVNTWIFGEYDVLEKARARMTHQKPTYE